MKESRGRAQSRRSYGGIAGSSVFKSNGGGREKRDHVDSLTGIPFEVKNVFAVVQINDMSANTSAHLAELEPVRHPGVEPVIRIQSSSVLRAENRVWFAGFMFRGRVYRVREDDPVIKPHRLRERIPRTEFPAHRQFKIIPRPEGAEEVYMMAYVVARIVRQSPGRHADPA